MPNSCGTTIETMVRSAFVEAIWTAPCGWWSIGANTYIVTFTYANDGSPFPRPLFDMRCVVMRENIMNGNSYDMVLDLLLIRYVFFDALFMPLL